MPESFLTGETWRQIQKTSVMGREAAEEQGLEPCL